MAMNRRLALKMVVGACLSAPCALSVSAGAMPEATPASAAASASAPPIHAAATLTDGVVESVDAGSGIVTLRHGEIVDMQMPAMTMTFGVADRKMLGAVKAGDNVKFRVELLGNVPTITWIEPATARPSRP